MYSIKTNKAIISDEPSLRKPVKLVFNIVFGIIVSVILTIPTILMGQSGSTNTSALNQMIGVSVELVSLSSIDIETISNMNLGRVRPGDEEIFIDPRTDPGAGLMRAIGKPNSTVRISFQEERELVRVGGGNVIQFTYLVAGNTIEDQVSAEPLLLENRDLVLSQTGEYFFWIGGRLTLEGVEFGQYEGEFTIEIDYL